MPLLVMRMIRVVVRKVCGFACYKCHDNRPRRKLYSVRVELGDIYGSHTYCTTHYRQVIKEVPRGIEIVEAVA